MSTPTTPNASSLFANAQAAGTLSKASVQVLTGHDLGNAINQAMGVAADDIPASEVILVSMLMDDSGSMDGLDKDARAGHNLVLDALEESKQKDGVLAHTLFLNSPTVFPYKPLKDAVRLDAKNYRPNGGTPLYAQSVVILGTVVAKAQEFADNGVHSRTVTVIVTDGGDNMSGKYTAADVKKIVTDMLKTENHIVIGIGIEDGFTDFRKVFRDMGLRDEWILTPKNSKSDLRRAFNVVSKSAMRASQNAASFAQVSKTGLGAFGP